MSLTLAAVNTATGQILLHWVPSCRGDGDVDDFKPGYMPKHSQYLTVSIIIAVHPVVSSHHYPAL